MDYDRIMSQLDEADRDIARISAEGGAHRREPSLAAAQASRRIDFSREARRLLDRRRTSRPTPPSTSSAITGLHLSVVARLLEAEYRKVNAAQAQIDQPHPRACCDISLIFGAASVLLALIFAAVTVRMVVAADPRHGVADGRIGPRLLAHAGGPGGHRAPLLARTARRTGAIADRGQDQSQRALDSGGAGRTARGWHDCLRLVDEAIGNVRQMSQLLRPTILDDFGLEAGLRWLAEGFAARTGIEVTVDSNYSGRLPDETETHLFRIAQEALTNIARHAARAARHGEARRQRTARSALSIQDDGRGLERTLRPSGRGLGLIGMRARARSAGGDVDGPLPPGRGCSN